MEESRYFIGALARETRLNPKTIRYWERVGLISPAARTEAGYRVYDGDAVSRIGFIKRSKRLGLRLKEIREILSIADGGGEPCQHTGALLRKKVSELERKITELQSLKAELTRLSKGCGRKPRSGERDVSVCPIIEE